MLLLDKYKPEKLEDIIGNKENINEMENWINEKQRNLLLLSGPSGIGKTLSSYLLLSKHNYHIIEFNIGINYYENNIYDMILNILLCKNVNEKKNAIILDEIDTMLMLNDKNELNKLLNIFSYIKKLNVPVICIYNDVNEKKISKKILKIKKISKYLRFNKLNFNETLSILNKICLNENIDIHDFEKELIINHSQYDMRRLLYIMQLIKYDNKNVKEILNIFSIKDHDYNINDSINNIFNHKINDDKLINMYKKDIMQFLPSIHENILLNLKNIKYHKYIELYKQYFKDIIKNDIILTKLYQIQIWDNEFFLPFSRSINEIGYKYNKNENNNLIKYSELLSKMNSFSTNYSLNKIFKQLNINDNKFYEYYFLTQIIKDNKNIKLNGIENLIKISDKINYIEKTKFI